MMLQRCARPSTRCPLARVNAIGVPSGDQAGWASHVPTSGWQPTLLPVSRADRCRRRRRPRSRRRPDRSAGRRCGAVGRHVGVLVDVPVLGVGHLDLARAVGVDREHGAVLHVRGEVAAEGDPAVVAVVGRVGRRDQGTGGDRRGEQDGWPAGQSKSVGSCVHAGPAGARRHRGQPQCPDDDCGRPQHPLKERSTAGTPAPPARVGSNDGSRRRGRASGRSASCAPRRCAR